jgi:hypothetical protein
MKVIDMPGLAKVSSGDLLRELTNELARVRRRLKRAVQKHKGLQVLKETLQPYLQPGDYEHLLERLKREVERLQREDIKLSGRCHDERFRQAVGDERFEKYLRERDEINRRVFGDKQNDEPNP